MPPPPIKVHFRRQTNCPGRDFVFLQPRQEFFSPPRTPYRMFSFVYIHFGAGRHSQSGFFEARISLYPRQLTTLRAPLLQGPRTNTKVSGSIFFSASSNAPRFVRPPPPFFSSSIFLIPLLCCFQSKGTDCREGLFGDARTFWGVSGIHDSPPPRIFLFFGSPLEFFPGCSPQECAFPRFLGLRVLLRPWDHFVFCSCPPNLFIIPFGQ